MEKEIDQDEVCAMCMDRNDTSPSFHCEGKWCGESTEIYLEEQEGEMDVESFKVGDRVECIEPAGAVSAYNLPLAGKYIITGFIGDNIKLEGETGAYSINRFKLSTKPKTTKENNMELNSSIRTVFVEEDNADYLLVEKMQRVFGGEIDENFTGAMILRDNKPKYIAEIKRLDDIEAKRLKEEAKKK